MSTFAPTSSNLTNLRNALNMWLEVKVFVRELLAPLAELQTISIQPVPVDTSSVGLATGSGTCARMPRVLRLDLPHQHWLQLDGIWSPLLHIKTQMSFVSIWHLLIIGMAAAVVWMLARPPSAPPWIWHQN
jgi:hypothetical protein